MSADNGIYILKCKDQCRVIHAQAIDNLYWSYITRNQRGYLVPSRIVEYFGEVKYTRSLDKAYGIANKLLSNITYVEYGIQIIPCNKTWNQILREAKVVAENELNNLPSWCGEYDIEKLNRVIERCSNGKKQ